MMPPLRGPPPKQRPPSRSSSSTAVTDLAGLAVADTDTTDAPLTRMPGKEIGVAYPIDADAPFKRMPGKDTVVAYPSDADAPFKRMPGKVAKKTHAARRALGFPRWAGTNVYCQRLQIVRKSA